MATPTVFAESLRHGVLVTELEPDEEDFAVVYRRLVTTGAQVG
jgi:hypothetical protein